MITIQDRNPLVQLIWRLNEKNTRGNYVYAKGLTTNERKELKEILLGQLEVDRSMRDPRSSFTGPFGLRTV